MSLSIHDLCQIVARSSTVFERVAPPFVPSDAGDAEHLIEARLNTWKHRVGAGSDDRFRRHFSWLGGDAAAARRAVAPCTYVGQRLPAWAEILAAVERFGASYGGGSALLASDGGECDEEPFEQALTPFVDVARQRLAVAAPALAMELDAAAFRSFEHGLLRRLSRISGRTLYAEFAGFRLARIAPRPGSAPWWAAAPLVDGPRRPLYTRFMRHLAQGGWAAIFREYPVLARCLASRVVDWVATIAEFGRRLAADRSILERTLADGVVLGPVVGAELGLSDPHSSGRTVIKAEFAGGVTLVYKPRSLGLERAFCSLIEWLNEGRAALQLKAAETVDCGTHGWMEFVPAMPCRDAGEVERYYRRVGVLLSLANILGAADLHQGNVIACGEYPVLVDLEVMMTAPIRSDAAAGEHEASGQEVWDSVLRTGLLPLNRVGIRGEVRRNGGLLHTADGSVRTDLHWADVNTDSMRMTSAPASQPVNVPYLASGAARVQSYVDRLVTGFVETSDMLKRERLALIEQGVLEPFRARRSRVVIRDTEVYSSILQRAMHPRFLHDGADWSIELDVVEGACTRETSRPSWWRAAIAERRALCRLDIPLFEARSDEADLRADGRIVAPNYLLEAGFPAAVARLNRLHDEDVHVQVQCIRLATECARGPNAGPSTGPIDFVREARKIGDLLRQMTFTTSSGDTNWIGVRTAAQTGVRGLRPLEWDLYSGRCGVALFLAALENCCPGGDRPPFAAEVLRPLVGGLTTRSVVRGVQGATGAAGIGGVVYGLARIAEFLRSQAVLDCATAVARALDVAAIEAETNCDVIAGLGGAILGFVALHETVPAAGVLDRALRCGRRLVQQSLLTKNGRIWKTSEGRAYHGFAHGSAGIAYALSRLYRATGEPVFRTTALEALAAGDGAVTTHWTGARGSENVSAPMRESWCRGTVGHALARLGCGAALNTTEALAGVQELVTQVATSQVPGRLDQMCCGNMGGVELLLESSTRSGACCSPTAAHAAAEKVVDRATRRGSYAVSGIDDVFSPGFYHGLAGIGYGLLRLSFGGLPSVLLWE